RRGRLNRFEVNERPTIVNVLIAMTKFESEVAIQKYVADSLARALGAIVPPDAEGPSGASPLKAFDFQGAKLQGAWWKRIDARDIDFYAAHLRHAGLRGAFLADSVL